MVYRLFYHAKQKKSTALRYFSHHILKRKGTARKGATYTASDGRKYTSLPSSLKGGSKFHEKSKQNGRARLCFRRLLPEKTVSGEKRLRPSGKDGNGARRMYLGHSLKRKRSSHSLSPSPLYGAFLCHSVKESISIKPPQAIPSQGAYCALWKRDCEWAEIPVEAPTPKP